MIKKIINILIVLIILVTSIFIYIPVVEVQAQETWFEDLDGDGMPDNFTNAQ